jgi:hypothetical protein
MLSKMKKIILHIIMFFAGTVFFSCNPEIEVPELTENNYPRIMGAWPEKRANGTLGVFNAVVDNPLTIKLQFTPSALCEGTWYLEDEEYCTGNTFEYTPTTTGDYNLKFVVKTSKYTTSREAIIRVEGIIVDF